MIQPTSEEVITELARAELKSYRRLPVHFYQIQTKFRDERRPRFGIMRGREFVMKDGYSFHADYEDLRARVPQHARHLHAHLHAPGPEVPRVAADTGAIGGTGSHEFHVLADSGEDAIAFSPAVRLRRQRRAGGSARARRSETAPTARDEEGADAGQDDLRGRRGAAQAAAAEDGEVGRA